MIVCLCHRISERDIHVEVAGGTRCFEVLQDQTRVASSCGACHDCAREVFDSACACHGGPLMQIAEPQVAVARA